MSDKKSQLYPKSLLDDQGNIKMTTRRLQSPKAQESTKAQSNSTTSKVGNFSGRSSSTQVLNFTSSINSKIVASKASY